MKVIACNIRAWNKSDFGKPNLSLIASTKEIEFDDDEKTKMIQDREVDSYSSATYDDYLYVARDTAGLQQWVETYSLTHILDTYSIKKGADDEYVMIDIYASDKATLDGLYARALDVLVDYFEPELTKIDVLAFQKEQLLDALAHLPLEEDIDVKVAL